MTRAIFKPRPDVPAEEFLTAAECAARTGLTVKALRIYERQGLIKPPRSPNGWRRYGPTELERLSGHQAPSLAELCELIKGLQNNRSVDMTSAAVLTRQLINENITPEEERAWLTWLAEHPEDSAAIQEFTKNQRALSDEARQLMEQGVDPASDAMQDVLRRQNELLVQYGMRERNRRLRAWNSNTLHKWCSKSAR